jgi:N-acetylglucosamine-6-phosphate deacetylase
MTVITGRLVGAQWPPAPGWIEVRNGRIRATGIGRPPRRPDLEHDGEVSPGLCDLQVNGAAGFEGLDGGAGLDAIDAVLARHGVTRWLAALPTAEDERVHTALAAIAERMDDPRHGLMGAHIEGPFLSPRHAGVHDQALLRVPSDGVPHTYRARCVRVVTLAPELPGALALIADLRRRSVAVALGHSGADAATAARALDAGARLVTHLFNAMSPLLHRAPGLAGVALADRRALPCVIADGHHIDPLVLRIVRAAAPGRVVLVSDASAAAETSGGEHRIGGAAVRLASDGAVRTVDGKLAGGGVLLDEMLTRWITATGARRAHALAAASARPARAIGLSLGLRPGCEADLVLRSGDGDVRRVMRAGRWLRSRRPT